MALLSNFHFLRPWWLLLLLPPLLAAAIRLLSQRENTQWKGVIAPHLLKHLVTQRSSRTWLSPEIVLLPFAALLAVAMAGPTYHLADNPQGPDDTTLLLAVDLSSSMAGKDIGPSRIARLRLKLRDLINLRRGSRIGLVAVAGNAHIVMPPTDDGDALIPYVDVLDPKLMPTDGENFAELGPLLHSLAQAEKGPTVVVLAGDSIPPDGAQALSQLPHQGISLVAWLVGTKEGVPGAGIPGLDRNGFDVLARSGANLVDLSLGQQDVRHINDVLDRARTAAANPDDASLWVDSGYLLTFIVAFGTLFWFRRGWVISRLSLSLLALLLSGCGGTSGDSAWLDLWMTPDQQGRRLFDQGNYKAAAEKFEDPMWKGVAYYTAHDWEKAQEQFKQIDSTVALFNLADAYAQNKEIASAVATYDKVLRRQPTFYAARKNRDYFKEVLAGLTQTQDTDELKKVPQKPADSTKTKFRPDQLEGYKDPAAETADKEKKEKDSLSAAENAQWMKQVATNPADFLRAKFAVQEQQTK